MPIRHGVEETPRRLVTDATLDERHVMRRFDADHGEELHEQTGRSAMLLHDGVVLRNFEFDRPVVLASFVPVRRLQALGAVAGALQPGVADVEAILTLPFRQLAAHVTLSGSW